MVEGEMEKTAIVPSAEAETKMDGFEVQVARALMEPLWRSMGDVQAAVKREVVGERTQRRTDLSTEPERRMSVDDWPGRKRTALTRSVWPLRVAWMPRREGPWEC